MDIDIYPVLYVSNQTIVDEFLIYKGERFSEEPEHSLFCTVCDNKLSGCTMVINKELREEILRIGFSEYEDSLKQRLHDTWCIIIANIRGKIIYDNEGRILYRQHAQNVVGANDNRGLLSEIKSKMKKIFNKEKRNGRSRTSIAIMKCFPWVEDNRIKLLADCYTVEGKIRLLKNYELFSNEYRRINFIIYVVLGLI